MIGKLVSMINLGA